MNYQRGKTEAAKCSVDDTSVRTRRAII